MCETMMIWVLMVPESWYIGLSRCLPISSNNQEASHLWGLFRALEASFPSRCREIVPEDKFCNIGF